MLNLLKNSIRQAALRRWAPSVYSPNGAPPPLYRLFHGRQNLSYMDIGAFDGSFCDNLTEFAGFKSVILVEPITRLAAALRKRFPDYTVVEAAIGDEAKNIDFNEYPEAPYMSSILNLSGDAPEHASIANGKISVKKIKQRTIDDLAEQYKVNSLDLLKIDTQGAELAVLRGATSLLSRTAAIWVEVSFVKLYEQSCLFHEVHESLYNHGFQLTELTAGWRSPSGELAQADGLFQRRSSPD